MTLSPAVALTRELLRCPSVTPADAGALDVLERALNAAGFASARIIFPEAGTPDVDNLFARIGEGAPHLVFAGHTDVVPPGDMARWRFDPFSRRDRGRQDLRARRLGHEGRHRRLRRRGACVCRAGMASPKGAISFLITGDEEGPSINGTVKLLDWARERGERFDHCIVGEPTNVDDARRHDQNRPARLAQRAHLSCAASRAMSPIRSARDNPLPALARVVAALSAARIRRRHGRISSRSNLEVTSIDVGNPATNVIPAEARASFNIRFNDRLDAGEPGGAHPRGRARGGGRHARSNSNSRPATRGPF